MGVQTQSWTGFWQQGESGLRTLDRAMDLGPGFGGDTFLVRDADGLAVLRGRDLELVRRIEGMPPGGSQGIVLPSPDGSRVFAAGGIYPLRLRGSALLEVDADLPARELSSLRSENWVRGAWSADGSRLTTISIGGVHGETDLAVVLDGTSLAGGIDSLLSQIQASLNFATAGNLVPLFAVPGENPDDPTDFFWQHHLGNYWKYLQAQYGAA